MTGKLSCYEDGDEKVEAVLKNISKEKEMLLKQRNGRADNKLKDRTELENDELPNNWAWIRFGETGLFKKGPFGSALTKAMFVPKAEDTVKVYEQQHAINKNHKLGTYYITREYFEESMNGFEVKSGDIIVSCAGTIGETYIMPENIEQGIINQALMRVSLVPSIYEKFFLYYFEYGLKKAAQEESNGSAIKNIPPFDVMKNWAFPITSMQEQKRIVEKIEEAFEQLEIIDEMQKQYSSDLEILKSKIIDAGIQGKLTEQLPEDGTAEELLAQIAEEKKQLIKEKKIKATKVLPEITEDEIPFEIPDTWKFVRIGDVCELNPKNDLSDNLEVSFIPMACVTEGYNNKHSFEIKKWGDIKKGFNHFQNNDVGVAKITPCFQNRKSVVFRDLLEGYGAGTTELSIVRGYEGMICPDYLLWYFKSAYFINNGIESFTGVVGQQRIHKDYLKTCVLPLPPYPEQVRIADKINSAIATVENM